MFGTATRTPARPVVRDDGHDAGMNRDGHGVNPLMGGVIGMVASRLIDRHVTSRIARRFGGLPGLLVGTAATYAINRLLHSPRRR